MYLRKHIRPLLGRCPFVCAPDNGPQWVASPETIGNQANSMNQQLSVSPRRRLLWAFDDEVYAKTRIWPGTTFICQWTHLLLETLARLILRRRPKRSYNYCPTRVVPRGSGAGTRLPVQLMHSANWTSFCFAWWQLRWPCSQWLYYYYYYWDIAYQVKNPTPHALARRLYPQFTW